MTSQVFITEDYLTTVDEIAAYLDAALEDGDDAVMLQALRQVANKTGGMTQLAKDAHLNRVSLYRALSANGNPKLDTLTAVLKTMGLRLSVARVSH